MSRYKIDTLVRIYVNAPDPEKALITARNALENATDSEGVTGIYVDPRHTAVQQDTR